MTNIIEYESIRTASMTRLLTQDLYIPNLHIIKEYGQVIPIISYCLLIILQVADLCITFYKLKKENILIHIKKERKKVISMHIFELPFKYTQESKPHWLQYLVLHKIVLTNKFQKQSLLYALFVKEMKGSIDDFFITYNSKRIMAWCLSMDLETVWFVYNIW